MWGGDIELDNIAEIKNLHVKVYGPRREKDPLLVGPINRKKVIHLWLDNGHYQNYNPKNGEKKNVPMDGNCLFHAVLRAISKSNKSTIKEVATLRNQIADKLQSLVTKINNREQEIREGTQENGWRPITITLTHENHNPIYGRFNSIFKAENKEQLQEAYDVLPPGQLREEALQLRRLTKN